jgi:hypothetical protein
MTKSKKFVSVSLPADFIENVKLAAKQNHRTISSQVIWWYSLGKRHEETGKTNSEKEHLTLPTLGQPVGEGDLIQKTQTTQPTIISKVLFTLAGLDQRMVKIENTNKSLAQAVAALGLPNKKLGGKVKPLV